MESEASLETILGQSAAPEGPHSLVLHPHMLVAATFPGFALYVRDGTGAFKLFHGAQEPVYLNTWNKLGRAGSEVVFVRGEDADLCLDYVEKHLAMTLGDGAVPVDLAAQWAYCAAGRAMRRLLDAPGEGARFDRTRAVLGHAVGFLARKPAARLRMTACSPPAYGVWSHSLNVGLLLADFAGRFLSVRDGRLLAEIGLGGALHDLGKTLIPQSILTKPSELNYREFAEVVRHPPNGLRIARPHLKGHDIAQRIIVQHHENFAGGGYPEGRSGQAINVFARAARMADTFDALTTRRPYGAAMDTYQALNTMISSMAGHFEMRMLRRFVRYFAGAGQSEPRAPQAITAPPIAPPADRWQPPPAPLPEPPVAGAMAFVRALRVRLDDVTARAGRPDAALERLDLILRAMERRLAGRFEAGLRAARQAAARRGPSPRPLQGRRLVAVRGLFPLVWQVDEWLHALEPLPDGSIEGQRLRGEFMDCLRGLRRHIAHALLARGVEQIGTAGYFDPRLHRAVRCRMEPGRPCRLLRVGYLHRSAAGVEVIEPARVCPRAQPITVA